MYVTFVPELCLLRTFERNRAQADGPSGRRRAQRKKGIALLKLRMA
eukprot:COSAG02_NODE_5168_length_4575_cov_2.869303_2_plen_46_part_00